MSQFSFCFQSSQKNVYITSSGLFTCWDQYVPVLTKGKFSFTAASWLKWEKLQVRSSTTCHAVQKWQIWKVNLKACVKGTKGNLKLSPEKKSGVFTSQGLLTMVSLHLSQLSKTTIISSCYYIKTPTKTPGFGLQQCNHWEKFLPGFNLHDKLLLTDTICF